MTQISKQPVKTINVDGVEYVTLEDYVNALPSGFSVNPADNAMFIAKVLLDHIDHDKLSDVISHVAIEL